LSGELACIILINLPTRDGGSVSVYIGIFWSICIGWIEKYSIGKYWYFLVVSVLVSVNIGIF